MIPENPLFSAQNLSQLPYETPFMLTSIAAVRENYLDLQDCFPGARIHYALKANPDREILRGLKDMGSSFEIASHGELELLKSIGVDPKTVIYSNPVKPANHIALTHKEGVSAFAFDSENELKKIAANAPGAKVYLRIKVPEKGSTFPLSSKFGAPAGDTVKLMKAARKLGLIPAGITFHVGSQSAELDTWKAAVEVAGRAIWELQQAGIILEFLNLGGGWPVTYTKKVPAIVELASVVQNALQLHLPYPLQLYLEPGRFLAANASVMVASVIGLEKRSNTDWVYLDVGAFQGLIEFLEMPGWQLPIYTDREDARFKRGSFTVTGPTCDSQDTLGDGISLPHDIQEGDRVFIGNTGAYTLTYGASSFNGFSLPKVYYTETTD